MKSGINIVFYRPHASVWFKNPIVNFIKRQLLPNKYEQFFDYVLKSDLDIYLTNDLFQTNGLKGVVKSIIDAFQLIIWCMLNKVSLRRVRFIFSKNGLQGKDILFMMLYGNLTHESDALAKGGRHLADFLSDVNIYKVIHMTHYAYNPKISSANLAVISPNLLVAENNLLRHSDFFKHFFSDIPHYFYQMAYTPAGRFIKHKQFGGRINKLVVTGTITFKMQQDDFIKFYKTNELQPLRRSLYENAHMYTNQMDCMISDLNASRELNPAINRIQYLHNFFKKLFGIHPQKKYYKQNIVDIYNSYKMFTVPEELCDLPAIGFVEGMACGSAFFGISSPMYSDLGMLANVHYVSYDGSLEDLMRKVSYYQDHNDQLELIASNGYEFVTNNLNVEAVYRKFIDQLKSQVIS